MIACSLWLAGCVGFPVQEMSDARQALEAAQEADAAIHAYDDFQQAQMWLKRAENELDEGDYDAASDSAVYARDLAFKARQKAMQATKNN